ncbi:hypothetical protein [Streptomyces sp. NPDC005209]|uniref:DUF6907 domain-containing protein n=1 Tax=Streptomyces sp. NPDC005209 TaxID=3156715 RepID=UPI0033A22BC2
MGNTVSPSVNLPAIPPQPTSGNPYGLMATPVPALPRTWSFIDRHTGQPVTYTCMQGCTLNHASDMATPSYPEDVWCWFWDDSLTLPVNENGEPEEFRVLSTVIKVEPWSTTIAERLPFAVVELIDDHFIDGLDPDGLETVINTLAGRVEAMRETHRRLVEVREEYKQQVARNQVAGGVA